MAELEHAEHGVMTTDAPQDAVGATVRGVASREFASRDHASRAIATRGFEAVPIAVAIIGIITTAALSWAAWLAHDRNEDRLLEQRTREAAAVLTSAASTLQAPLLAASDLADGNDGDSTAFEHFMTPALDRKQFVAASLWRIDGPEPQLVASVGSALELGGDGAPSAQDALTRAAATTSLTIVDLIDRSEPRLGFASTSSAQRPRFVTYAENSLAADRTSQVRSGTAWSGLDFSIYLSVEDRTHLVGASTDRLPLAGRRARVTVPLGTSDVLLVMTPRGELGGELMALLPWITAGTGAGLTALSVLLAHHLTRQRWDAMAISTRNRELFEAERDIATSLQQGLLPDRLPDVEGLAVAVRYRPGSKGVQIGGDWYDVTLLDDSRLLLVIGDVSGHGIAATAVMASLRFSTIAYAREGHSPAMILSKLGRLLELTRDGRFATMVCATVDAQHASVVFANAGHPNPIVISGGHAVVLDIPVGTPIGVDSNAAYAERVVSMAPGSTLLAFTDGLFERRGENIDLGMERLRRRSETTTGELSDLLDRLIGDHGEGTDDDTALLGVRWLSQATPTDRPPSP